MNVNYVRVEGAENAPPPLIYFPDISGKTLVIRTENITETDLVTKEVRVIGTLTYTDYV